jgi:protein phosphatase 1 regulatory subunit 7
MRRQHRIQDPDIIDENAIASLLEEYKEVIIQFSSEVYDSHILSKLNRLAEKHDENLTIRFYGHYSSIFDCSVVDQIPEVKSLSIDCLRQVHNIESITRLKNLKQLGIGVFELKETDILSAKNFQNLNRLYVFDTKTKALNLEYLSSYKYLDYLIVAGHTKNIEAIGSLKKLEQLSLNGISKVPLSFVNELPLLHTLNIILGGRDNITEIEGNNIENLNLTWIRGLNDLEDISRFHKLKTLLVQDHIRLPKIHFDKGLTKLTDIKILNCKTLASITGLENLPELHQLRVYKTDIDFEKFIKQPLPSKLKILAFYTAKNKVDSQLKSRLKELGYIDGLDRN